MQVQRVGGIDARLIMHKHKYTDSSDIAHPYDVLLQDGRSNEQKRKEGLCYSASEIYRLFSEADILHFHNFLTNHYVFKLYPNLLDFLKRKKVVVQFHSPRRNIPQVSKILKNKNVDKKLVIAQFQAAQFPECEIVPNVVPIYDEMHTPLEKDMITPAKNCSDLPSIPRICYSPSNTKLKGWNNKGSDKVLKSINSLSVPHEFIMIENTPFEECLRIKQSCDICIDEVMTGSYHMSSLEAMSQGLAVINAIDEDCVQAMKKYTNTDYHPMVKATPDNLSDILTDLCTDPVKLRSIQQQSRNFMRCHWDTPKIMKRFMEIYTK
jgi:hypothetical protein